MKTCQSSTKQSTQAKKKVVGEEKVQDERTQEVSPGKVDEEMVHITR